MSRFPESTLAVHPGTVLPDPDRSALESTITLLMGCYRIDERQAFALLRAWASARHVRLHDLCTTLLAVAAGTDRLGSLCALLGSGEFD